MPKLQILLNFFLMEKAREQKQSGRYEANRIAWVSDRIT